jgi:hypothetical protein
MAIFNLSVKLSIEFPYFSIYLEDKQDKALQKRFARILTYFLQLWSPVSQN